MTIDLLRHMLAMAVIIQHMHSESRYSLATNLQIADVVYWIDGAVVGFFALSGYFFSNAKPLSEYLKGRVVRLLVPFLVFSLAYAVALAVLGKSDLWPGLWKTVTLHGSGMQLYFLPYLLLVVGTYATYSKLAPSLASNVKADVLIALVLLGATLANGSDESTGAGIIMLPLYALAFLLGRLVKSWNSAGYRNYVLLALLYGVGMWDHRFMDMALAISLLLIAIGFERWAPDRRLAGSGGVYLLHTPIVNFAISTVLVHFGLVQIPNVILSVILTYALCLLLTLAFDHLLPRWKWLLLE
ncbi:MAG: hypothetical protein EOP91_00050 [Lysobacteraceae bacterium]|nr:MAG: hypothetical protein EOP91_00050 [Xanthomonadaceae bacterium]